MLYSWIKRLTVHEILRNQILHNHFHLEERVLHAVEELFFSSLELSLSYGGQATWIVGSTDNPIKGRSGESGNLT